MHTLSAMVLTYRPPLPHRTIGGSSIAHLHGATEYVQPWPAAYSPSSVHQQRLPCAACPTTPYRAQLRMSARTGVHHVNSTHLRAKASRCAPVQCGALYAVRRAASSGAGFWQLTAAFFLGGLFFSTALAAAGAVYAVGIDNVQRGLALLRLVVSRVLKLVWKVLLACKATLLGDSKSKWKDVWRQLREGLGEARRAAAEGVEAVRLEAGMQAGAVGLPGLVPVQYALDRLLPYIGTTMEEALGKALAETRNSKVRKLRLVKFSVGDVPPKLFGARAYDLGSEALAYDVDAAWQSKVVADVEVVTKGVGARIPVSVRNVRLSGPLRVVAAPLISAAPGYGALLLSLPTPPKVAMDVRVAGGEVTKVPWLRGEIEKAIQAAIAENALWPKRVVVPSTTSARMAGRPILSEKELHKLATDDPMRRAELRLAEQPALKERGQKPKIATALDIMLNANDMPDEKAAAFAKGAASATNVNKADKAHAMERAAGTQDARGGGDGGEDGGDGGKGGGGSNPLRDAQEAISTWWQKLTSKQQS